MTHHKRRHRRRAGIKGHCGMCMLRKTDGRRNRRLLTVQERAQEVSQAEGFADYAEEREWERRSRYDTWFEDGEDDRWSNCHALEWYVEALSDPFRDRDFISEVIEHMQLSLWAAALWGAS